MSNKETKLPGGFIPDGQKNVELFKSSLTQQYRQGESVVAETIRLERERITAEINKRLTEAKGETGWYVREYLVAVRDEIVNKP